MMATGQDATDATTSTATATATEKENQELMRSCFTTKTRKRSNTPVDDKSATKKAGTGSPPNNGVGQRPSTAVPRSNFHPEKASRTLPPANTGTEKERPATPLSEGLHPRSLARKGMQKTPATQGRTGGVNSRASGGEMNVGKKKP